MDKRKGLNMKRVIRLLQAVGLILSGFGCYATFNDMMIALILAFTGLSFIFTAIQIEEAYYD